MLGLAFAITTAITLLGLQILHVQHFQPERQLSAATLFNLLKVAFAVAAGIGGVVALVTAYRRQRIAEFADQRHELAEQREQTRLLNERFTTAAGQLGHDNPAIRLAGVYAMAGLADDWPQQRQTCVDVLCAYLRMPYQPDPDDDAPTAERLALLAGREVRHTVIRVITAHLQPDDRRAPTAASWHGLNLDFTGVIFDGGDFSKAQFTSGRVDFSGAQFTTGHTFFSDTQFTGGEIYFAGARFSGGLVSFHEARFAGGLIDFEGARFTHGLVDFIGAQFTGGHVAFIGTDFAGGEVCFHDARFSGGQLDFVDADFAGARVYFKSAEFTGTQVNFELARFSGGQVDFFTAMFTGGTVDFRAANFAGGQVDFGEPRRWAVPPIFPDWGDKPPAGVAIPAQKAPVP